MAFLAAINHLLFVAHAERSREKTLSLLNKALSACREWRSAENDPNSFIYEARIHGELAIEQEHASQRAREWQSAFSVLKGPVFQSEKLQQDRGIVLLQDRAIIYSQIAVDCFQDQYSAQPIAERLQLLRNAEKLLTAAIGEAEPTRAATLLSRKSSILRHLARTELSRDGRLGKTGESKRCIELAISKQADVGALVELAETQWELAQYASSDKAYADQLREAETSFSAPSVLATEIGRLSYARFLRRTYRSLEACTIFSECLASCENLRRLLRDAPLYAEAAISLWFNQNSIDAIRSHLSEAKSLLETSIASGYKSARAILDLAYLSAILDGPPTGSLILREICPRRADVDWNQVAKLAINHGGDDFVTEGFVLGMDHSGTWNRLGTFAKRFLMDLEFAEVLYRAAIRIDQHDAIALTNLARLIIEAGDTSRMAEAERLLLRAQNFSDRRFTWWRPLLAEIELRKGIQPPVLKASRSKIGASLKNIRDVRKEFRAASVNANAQQRGYCLEVLVYELAKMTFGLAAPAYEIRRDAIGVIQQVDGYFEHHSGKYRVECKWRSEKASPAQIGTFFSALDVAGISGLFISMAGFTPAAVEKAREFRGQKPILLMDGVETTSLFEGKIRFDELICQKRLRFDQLSDPYHRVILAMEAV